MQEPVQFPEQLVQLPVQLPVQPRHLPEQVPLHPEQPLQVPLHPEQVLLQSAEQVSAQVREQFCWQYVLQAIILLPPFAFRQKNIVVLHEYASQLFY